jgi:hypothetical protein
MNSKTQDKRLWDATAHLVKWQKANSGNTAKRCLAAVREALKSVGMALPKSDVDYPGLFAIDCGRTLAVKPNKWGWQLLGTNAKALPKDQPCLVAIWKPSTGVHVSNATYKMNLYWRLVVAYVFVPIETAG